MSLLDAIRKDAIAARKARSATAPGLVTLIGEVESKAKTRPQDQPLGDDEVLEVVRKFLKSNAEMLEHARRAAPQAVERLEAERAAYAAYLPRQMTEAELEAFARPLLDGGAGLGAVMAALKAERAGRYDGRHAAELVRRLAS